MVSAVPAISIRNHASPAGTDLLANLTAMQAQVNNSTTKLDDLYTRAHQIYEQHLKQSEIKQLTLKDKELEEVAQVAMEQQIQLNNKAILAMEQQNKQEVNLDEEAEKEVLEEYKKQKADLVTEYHEDKKRKAEEEQELKEFI